MIVFPVLQEDGFNEAKCEILSPAEALHAGASKSYHPAPLCFSFGLWHACSQNPCQTWGREYLWWVPKTGWALLREDVCLTLPSFLPRNDLLPWRKPKLFLKKSEFTLSLSTDPNWPVSNWMLLSLERRKWKKWGWGGSLKSCFNKEESIFMHSAGCRIWFN